MHCEQAKKLIPLTCKIWFLSKDVGVNYTPIFKSKNLGWESDFGFILTISSLQQGKSTSALLSSNVSLAKYVNIYGEWLCHFVVHIQKCVLG